MRALVTGISGQDGSYLAELLLQRGYEICGLIRRPLSERMDNIEHLRNDVELVVGDVRDSALIERLLQRRPDEMYHLAGPTFVPTSWQRPAETLAAVAGGTAAVLEAVAARAAATRVFVAGSREIFAGAVVSPQAETTPFSPNSPYGVAKLAGHLMAGVMRERRGLHVCSAILFNHESPRRAEHFVTRKVTSTAAAIKLGLERELVLGDLDAVRDWCFAGDAMRAAWMILNHESPDDYVIASGVGRTIADLVATAFAAVDLRSQDYVRVDPQLVRPREQAEPVGDARKAERVLGWRPETSFEDMIEEMVRADLERLAKP